MPTTNLAEQTTEAILDYMNGTSSWPDDFSMAQIAAELSLRLVPNTYEVEEMRGGIRPTRPQ